MSNNMTDPDRWYFSKEKLYDSPSRKCGIDGDKELSYRQQAANFIQDMGQKLQVTQLCINTAIVYMHRFYMFHSFSKFHRNAIAACALFLAAKVEEQPRKLEHVIKVAHFCLNIKPNKQCVQLDVKSREYIRQANELVINENIMLQTLGFEIGIEHPHTSVVKCCQLVRATKDLAQTSYFLATNSLHLTTMCLQYKPTVVACFCIHMACKWSNWEIPRSNEGRPWFFYVDETVTLEMLERLTSEFLVIFDRCPTRLKRRIASGEKDLSNDPNKILLPMSSSSDKKQVQADQESKQRIFSKPNSDQQSNKNNPQPSTSRSVVEPNLNHNHLPCNGPIKDPKKESIDRNFQSKSDNVNINKQYEKSKDNSAHYATFRDKKESENKLVSQPLSKDYNKPNNLSNKAPVPQSKENKDSKFSFNNSETNDSNNKNSITNVNQKPTKQQILLEKQRQIDERNKNRPKNQDYLWSDTNKSNVNLSKINNSTNNNTSSTNIVGQSFYENLMNNPVSYNNNSNSSNDNSLSKSPKLNWDNSAINYEDFTDSRKDLNSELKMEFSDNDSNQSNTGVNLNSLPFMSDTINSSVDNRKPLKNSFMEIFKNEETPKNSSSDFSSSNVNLTDLRPQQPPKMLSPLRHDDMYSSSFKKAKTEPTQPSKSINYRSGQSNFNKPKMSSPNKGQFSSNLNNTDRSMTSLAPSLNVNNQQFLQHQNLSMHNNQINTAHHSQNQQTSSSNLSTLPTQNSISTSISSQPAFQGHTHQQLSTSTHSMPPYSMSSFSNSSLNFSQNKSDSTSTNNQFFNNSLPQLVSASNDTRSNLSSAFNQQIPHQVDKNIFQDMYTKPTTSKSKEKDRSEKHHKKHKSKDKHKSKHKDKSKDKDRSSKYSVEKEMINPSPIKLIIKKGGNEESLNGDEKPIEKLKIVIPKSKMSYQNSNDRKRRLSPKDGRERSSKISK